MQISFNWHRLVPVLCFPHNNVFLNSLMSYSSDYINGRSFEWWSVMCLVWLLYEMCHPCQIGFSVPFCTELECFCPPQAYSPTPQKCVPKASVLLSLYVAQSYVEMCTCSQTQLFSTPLLPTLLWVYALAFISAFSRILPWISFLEFLF